MAKKDSNGPRDELSLLCRKVYSLISAKRYDDARLIIDTEQKRFPEAEAHQFVSLSAVLHESLGEIDKSIALMRQALQEKPAWLPHLYRLSVMLMDAEHWADADVVLKEIIALSLAQDDVYFLDEGRFRRAVCLHMLGLADELSQAKAEIPAGTRIFIGDRHCLIDDILK
jgi:tetratricopeptide (TPR) repeat protein